MSPDCRDPGSLARPSIARNAARVACPGAVGARTLHAQAANVQVRGWPFDSVTGAGGHHG